MPRAPCITEEDTRLHPFWPASHQAKAGVVGVGQVLLSKVSLCNPTFPGFLSSLFVSEGVALPPESQCSLVVMCCFLE